MKNLRIPVGREILATIVYLRQFLSKSKPSRELSRVFLKTLVPILLSLSAAGQVTAPKVGIVRYSDGSIHSIQGLAGNMIVCDLPFNSTEAASFSDSGGLVSQQGVIRLLGPDFTVIAEYQAGEIAPVLDIETDLTSALAWLPSKHSLLRWDGTQFTEAAIAEPDLQGQVTALQAVNPKQARLLITMPGGTVSSVTFSTRNGSLISYEPVIGVRGYAFKQSFFFLYTDQKLLVADNMNGYRRSVALPAPDLLIERMSSQWLHLYSPSLNQDWALHLTQADLQLSMLPALATQKPTHSVATSRTTSGEPR